MRARPGYTSLAALAGGIVAILLIATPFKPQSARQTSFMTTLGNDTVAFEQYSRTGNMITGDWVSVTGGVLVHHYVVSLRPDGSPEHATVELRRASGHVATKFDVTLGADSATIIATRDTAPSPVTTRAAAAAFART